jgi:3-oxoacyl-[acyl-carrier protein] reductase
MTEKRKRALITGGSRGIGKAICLMCAKNGYDVILNYKSNDSAANEVKTEIEKHNVNCKLLKFDVADFDNAQKIIEDEIQQNGNIDVLVLNAGVRKDTLFPVMTKEDWNTVVDVNFKSFYYITKPIVTGMFKQNHGKIVVISSTAGLTGMAGQVNYSSTKFGIIGAAKSLSIEVARRNINVNIVAPGFIDTEMTEDIKARQNEIVKTIPARRIGTVDDVANVVEFLISDKSSYINGQVIAVNGGVFT